jgi:hypothetical protein
MTLLGKELQAGDPTVSGWVITAMYLAVAAACLLNADTKSSARTRYSWRLLALVLLLTGINKQLDLQTDFNALGRTLLLSQGWYGIRQPVKNSIVFTMVLSGLTLLLLAAWKIQGVLQRHWLITTGLLLLFSFVILRASSIYGVPILGASGRQHGSSLLEPLGVLVTGAAVWYDRHRLSKSGRPDP